MASAKVANEKHGKADKTGVVDAFIGPLAMLLSQRRHSLVDTLPLATILASLSMRHQGAASAYIRSYQKTEYRAMPREEAVGFEIEKLIQELGLSRNEVRGSV